MSLIKRRAHATDATPNGNDAKIREWAKKWRPRIEEAGRIIDGVLGSCNLPDGEELSCAWVKRFLQAGKLDDAIGEIETLAES